MCFPTPEELNPLDSLRLQAILNLALAGSLLVSPDFYNVKWCKAALLVEPVNGDPYVFISPSSKVVFVSRPGSGTDKLKQRVLAGLLFERIAADEDHSKVQQELIALPA